MVNKKYVISSRNYFSRLALTAQYKKCVGEIETDITAVE